MSSLDGKITISNIEYRPCYVDNRKALFHCWSVRAYVRSGLMIGTASGQMIDTYGIVEYEDGSVSEVEPNEIRFADNLINEYCFSESEDITNQPTEKDAREAAAIIKSYCESRNSNPECDCLQCPIRDICDSDPYSWDV